MAASWAPWKGNADLLFSGASALRKLALPLAALLAAVGSSKLFISGTISYGLTVELYKQSGCVVVVFHMLSHKFPLRLRELCVKLMFLHPTDYGRKAEELLWRKVYYEVIQLIKTNKKASDGCPRALHTEV